MKQVGKEPFQMPWPLQYNVPAPTNEYPFLQLKLYCDPSTVPLPLTNPFDKDNGRAGHSWNEDEK